MLFWALFLSLLLLSWVRLLVLRARQEANYKEFFRDAVQGRLTAASWWLLNSFGLSTAFHGRHVTPSEALEPWLLTGGSVHDRSWAAVTYIVLVIMLVPSVRRRYDKFLELKRRGDAKQRTRGSL